MSREYIVGADQPTFYSDVQQKTHAIGDAYITAITSAAGSTPVLFGWFKYLIMHGTFNTAIAAPSSSLYVEAGYVDASYVE